MMIATRSILRLLLINNKKTNQQAPFARKVPAGLYAIQDQSYFEGIYIFIAKGRPSLYLTLSPKRPEYLHEDNSDQIQSEKSY